MVWLVGSEQEAKAIELLDAELRRASDRGVAVIAGSIVEARLTAFLKSQVQDDAKIWGRLTHSSAPLGSFSVKIDIAYMFCLISKEAHDDLVTMKNVRNRFAHDLSLVDFNDQPIAAMCANLALVDRYVVETHWDAHLSDTAAARDSAARLAEQEKRSVRFLIGGVGATKELAEPKMRYVWSTKVFTMALGANRGDIPLNSAPWALPQI